MALTKVHYIIGSSIIVTGIAIYVFRDKIFKKSLSNDSNTPVNTPTGAENKTVTPTVRGGQIIGTTGGTLISANATTNQKLEKANEILLVLNKIMGDARNNPPTTSGAGQGFAMSRDTRINDIKALGFNVVKINPSDPYSSYKIV